MSAKRLLLVVCLVALALAQQQEQPSPPEQEQAKVEGFQCSEIKLDFDASVDVEELADNDTSVFFEVGSSQAVKEYLQKGCSCVRNQFMYLRLGAREGLISNTLCKLEDRDAEARVSGLLLPVKQATVEDVKEGAVQKGEENLGKFGFVLLDVDDPRLPQKIQEEWKNLRKERLSALLQTFPKKTQEEAQAKASGEEGEKTEKAKEPEKSEQEPAQKLSTPLQRLHRRLLQQEEAKPQKEESKPEAKVEESKGGEDELTEGPLATFSPVKQEQPEPINVQILEHNKEKNYLIAVGGCQELVWILSSDPKSIDDETFEEIKSKLKEKGLNTDELKVEKTEVDEQCVMEAEKLKSPLSAQKAKEPETSKEKPEEQKAGEQKK